MMFNKGLLVVLFSSFSICSSTLLWRIETSPPAYIFGSIHVSYNLIWPYVSNETRQAFLSSTHIYGEADAKDETYWDGFLQCLVNRSKPIQRSKRSSYISDMLDWHLLIEARRLNKTVGSLEPPEIHCEQEGWRYNISTWKMIIDTIKNEMKNGTIPVKDLKTRGQRLIMKKYICDELTGQFLETFRMPNEVKQDTERRDEQMSQYIHSLLKRSNNNRYFFIVGAAHMVHKHQNLKVKLKNLGYKITRICTDRRRIKKKYGCTIKKTMKHCMKKTD